MAEDWTGQNRGKIMEMEGDMVIKTTTHILRFNICSVSTLTKQPKSHWGKKWKNGLPSDLYPGIQFSPGQQGCACNEKNHVIHSFYDIKGSRLFTGFPVPR